MEEETGAVRALVTCWIYGATLFWSVLFCFVALVPFLVMCLVKHLCPAWFGKFLRCMIVLYGRLIVRVAAFPVVRVRFECRSPRGGKPGIYVFNHRSGSDPFLAGLLHCDLVQAVNGWPMRLPFFGFFARLGGYIDISHQSYEETRDRIRELLAGGVSVVAFPEGTRSGSAAMGQFRSGVFKAALELDAPIYPGAIVGNERIPDRKFRFMPGTVGMRLLPPLLPSESGCANAFLLKNKVREMILEETRRMEKGK